MKCATNCDRSEMKCFALARVSLMVDIECVLHCLLWVCDRPVCAPNLCFLLNHDFFLKS